MDLLLKNTIFMISKYDISKYDKYKYLLSY